MLLQCQTADCYAVTVSDCSYIHSLQIVVLLQCQTADCYAVTVSDCRLLYCYSFRLQIVMLSQ